VVAHPYRKARDAAFQLLILGDIDAQHAIAERAQHFGTARRIAVRL